METNRRNFLTGLATASAVLPIGVVSSTEKTKHLHKLTWNELNPVIKSILTGCVRKWAYRNDLKWDDKYIVQSEIEGLLFQLKFDGFLHDFKVIADTESGKLKLKIGLKPEPSDEYKILTLYTENWEA